MRKIIQLFIEDAPKGCVIASKTCIDKAEDIWTLHIEPICKRIRFFDEEGTMRIRDYRFDEWEESCGPYFTTRIDDDESYSTISASFDTKTEIQAINWYLDAGLTLEDILEDVKSGDFLMGIQELTPSTKDLIKQLEEWEQSKPFTGRECKCHKETDDSGKEYYVLDWIK